jgi:hypothetical protein
MKGDSFCDDGFCKHDVDLERFLDLRNGVTRKIWMHESQRRESFVADSTECLGISWNVSLEIWVDYSEIRKPGEDVIRGRGIDCGTCRRWRTCGEDRPLDSHYHICI